MARAPRIGDIREDLPEGEWRALVANFMRDTHDILRRGISLKDNAYVHIREVRAYGDEVELEFDTPFKSPPIGVVVLEARNLDDYRTPGSMPGLAWRWKGGKVVVYNLSGLAEGVQYLIRFLVFGG